MINFAGRSKAGKSTVLLAAASVIGIGREGMLPNFNATVASLQEVTADFNDLVMPVNEIGLLKGTKRDAYQQLRPLIYRYAEGRDTSRHSSWGIANTDLTSPWHGIMLASSENSIEALAGWALEKRDEGEYARAFDVPAIGRGNPTVFDRFPRNVALADREKWARKQLSDLRKVCQNNHGLAFSHYVRYLANHHQTLRSDIELEMSVFLDSLQGEGQNGALQHAARNFAVIYAGAVMATRAGLLPWTLRSTRGALKACYRAGLKEAARAEEVSERTRRILLQRIKLLKPHDCINDFSRAEGWYSLKNRKKVYAVRARAYRRWLSSAEEQREGLRWLYDTHSLELKDGAQPDFKKTEWAITFPKGGNKGYRCFCFYEPKKG